MKTKTKINKLMKTFKITIYTNLRKMNHLLSKHERKLLFLLILMLSRRSQKRKVRDYGAVHLPKSSKILLHKKVWAKWIFIPQAIWWTLTAWTPSLKCLRIKKIKVLSVHNKILWWKMQALCHLKKIRVMPKEWHLQMQKKRLKIYILTKIHKDFE